MWNTRNVSVVRPSPGWMVSSLLSPGPPRRILPFAVFLIAFTIVMTILFMSFDLRAPKHRGVFNITEDLDFSSVGQDNPQFIAYVKAVHLHSPVTPKLISEEPTTNSLSLYIASILNNKVNGTFVETDAYGHDKSSTTEWLERALGWHGLLIQADPWDFLVMRHQKRNKATLVHACLSPTSYPKEVTFRQDPGSESMDGTRPIFTRVKCFPLFSLLLAANMTKVDYLSLNAEGAEVQVLKTLPLEHVEINVISVRKTANDVALMEFMVANGYKLIQKLLNSCIFKLDRIKELIPFSPVIDTLV